MKTLNVIGPGRVGRTLAALWARAGIFFIGDVYSRTAVNARAALALIGAGRAVKSVGDMNAADLWLITTPDAYIAEACAAVAAEDKLRPGDIVFHCSGALPASEMRASAAPSGAKVASVHPLKTFADAADAVESFAGTYCVAEGDAGALDVVLPAFERIGARLVTIEPSAKPLYHAASALVCNDLTALMEAGMRCYEQAGIARELAACMMEPLVRETVQNVFARGPAAALTGPVVRGDVAVVQRHLQRLQRVDERIARVYRDLSAIALDLARERASASPDALRRLAELLGTAPEG